MPRTGVRSTLAAISDRTLDTRLSNASGDTTRTNPANQRFGSVWTPRMNLVGADRAMKAANPLNLQAHHIGEEPEPQIGGIPIPF
jgi:hypothetical protein